MSYGIVICSVCNRELHQDGDKEVRNGWRHCESGTPICVGGTAKYPESDADIVGEWCGRDRGHEELARLDSEFGGNPIETVRLIATAAALSCGSTVAERSRITKTKKTRGNKYRMCECGSFEVYAKCCGAKVIKEATGS